VPVICISRIRYVCNFLSSGIIDNIVIIIIFVHIDCPRYYITLRLKTKIINIAQSTTSPKEDNQEMNLQKQVH